MGLARRADAAIRVDRCAHRQRHHTLGPAEAAHSGSAPRGCPANWVIFRDTSRHWRSQETASDLPFRGNGAGQRTGWFAFTRLRSQVRVLLRPRLKPQVSGAWRDNTLPLVPFPRENQRHRVAFSATGRHWRSQRRVLDQLGKIYVPAETPALADGLACLPGLLGRRWRWRL